MQLKLLLLLAIPVFLLLWTHATRASVAKNGCQYKCGNLIVPYPFGIGTGCYMDKPFEVLCLGSKQDPSPLRFVNHHKFHILEISMDSVRVLGKSPLTCGYSPSQFPLPNEHEELPLEEHFSYSHEKNNYVAVGCDFYARFRQFGKTIIIRKDPGCAVKCDHSRPLIESFSYCNGSNGCCHAHIQADLKSFSVEIYNTTKKPAQCAHAFVAEKNASVLHDTEQNLLLFPMTINWSITNSSCKEAHPTGKYFCGLNSRCIDNKNGLGYQCQCLEGYTGNAYLQSGCQDINECEDNNNPCQKGERCENISGSYLCTRPHGHLLVVSAIVTSVILVYWASLGLHRRRKNKIKQKFFKRNGGLLLQQQISVNKSGAMTIRFYTAEEIKKATDNFSQRRFLGKGGQGTVYKGILPDGSKVAIKKSNVVDEGHMERFANEVYILAQINHRNIVKLLGCCLEYEVPLLVYEYVSNGNLSQCLHEKSKVSAVSWKDRMRIAQEVAGALAYLHSYASPAIFHRDIKPGNILLDENFRAVVSDFGLSRSVPLSRTHLTTLIEGTFGYLDPEYFRSGQLTEKSDVYAFGVVLTELLTRRKAVSSTSSDEGLVSRFQFSMKHDCLFEILDSEVVMEAHVEDYLMVAKLAERCLKSNPKKRPSMKEVVADLEKLRVVQLQVVVENCRYANIR